MKKHTITANLILFISLIIASTGCVGPNMVKSNSAQPVKLKKARTEGSETQQKYYTDDGLQVEYETNQETVPDNYLAYQVGAGDELEIWLEKKETAAGRDYWNEHIEKFGGMVFNRYHTTIDPQGNINVPLAGELTVDNYSIKEIELKLKQALERYLVEPNVFVKINNYGSYNYSILGEVKKPGTYQIKKPITVSEAIAMGGGITKEGSRSYVYVARLGQKTKKISVAKIWCNNGLEQGVILERNHIVYVPHKFLFSLTELEQLSTIISNFTNVFFQWRDY